MIHHRIVLGTLFAVSFLAATPALAGITTSDVQFARGKTSTVLSGKITGDQTHDYVVRASAGQTLNVSLSGAEIVYFNVLPPGSDNEAIFIGSSEGQNFAGTLSASGAYKLRVYQMRATGRRGESGAYKLSVSVTGSGSAPEAGGSPAAEPAGGHGRDGLKGIAGMNSIAAIDEMSSRGFKNVDSFESGNTQYGIYYHSSSRVCAQLTMADGKVLDARDIKTHPKCH